MTGLLRRTSLLVVTAAVTMAAACSRSTEVLLVCSNPARTKAASYYRLYGGGAGGAQVLRIGVHPVIEQIDPDDVGIEFSQAYQVRFEWLADDRLAVTLPDSARDVQMPNGDVANGVILIVDYAPSAGGMFVDRSLAGCAAASTLARNLSPKS